MEYTIDGIIGLLGREGYVADRQIAVPLFLSLRMRRPLFLEGEAGVGKTGLAKALAAALGRRLVRLQCHEGLDLQTAVYEWNHARQMIRIRLVEASGGNPGAEQLEESLYSEQFLIRRPVLEALDSRPGHAPVLLIDELDRADEAFEAFLLEVLAEYQVSIPELGVIRAAEPPVVILTSNRTREVHDALKRRCLFHWLDYPSPEREREILRRKFPGLREEMARRITDFIQELRCRELFKPPGISEALDWAECLLHMEAGTLAPELVRETLGVLLKYQDDIRKVGGSLRQVDGQVTMAGPDS